MHSKASRDILQAKLMGEERVRIELSLATASTAARMPLLNLRIAFVRIDHVQAAPVPELHIDLARPVLVIAGDDEPAALSGEFGGQVQRPLLPDRFDHAVATPPSVNFLDPGDDSRDRPSDRRFAPKLCAISSAKGRREIATTRAPARAAS